MRKLLFLIFIFSCLILSAQQQDKLLSVNFSNLRLQGCLNKLARLSLNLSYDNHLVKQQTSKVNVSCQNCTPDSLLTLLLNNTTLRFVKIGNVYTIYQISRDVRTCKLSGYVKELNSKEEVPGAQIYFSDLDLGVITNTYGFYSINLPPGRHIIKVKALGMLAFTDTLHLEANMVVDFNLVYEGSLLEAFVKSVSYYDKQSNKQIGALQHYWAESVSGVGGEKDLMQQLQFSSKIQPAHDGGSDFMIRGVGNSNNMVLVDDAPVFHPTHAFGMFSIFNSDAIRSANLYSENIPLRFGERNSGILDVQLKEGDLENFESSASLGMISAKFTTEGPIVKNKASYFISGRRSTTDLWMKNFDFKLDLANRSFFDWSGKFNYHLNRSNRFFLSWYSGGDALRGDVPINWGNKVATLRWNHLFRSDVFTNLSLSYSNFFTRFNFGLFNRYSIQNITSLRLNYTLNAALRRNGSLTGGVLMSMRQNSLDDYWLNALNRPFSRKESENAVFFQYDKKLGKKIEVNVGARIPVYFKIGTGDTTLFYAGNNNGNSVIDTVVSVIGELTEFYTPIEPRFGLRYNLNKRNCLQITGDIVNQFVHIVNNELMDPPVELWYGSANRLPPQRMIQATLSWAHKRKGLEIAIRPFYRHIENLPDLVLNDPVAYYDAEKYLVPTSFKAEGIEVDLSAEWRKFIFSSAYTFTRTIRQGNWVNNNLAYPAFHSRPHFFNGRLIFSINKNWSVVYVYVLHSGSVVTLPSGQIVLGGIAYPVFESKNGGKLPLYHRMDFGCSYNYIPENDKWKGQLIFNMNNFYNRYNPSIIYASQDSDDPGKVKLNSLSYLPIFPTLTIRCTF